MPGRKGANMETVTLTLTVNEVNAILQTLAQLPTSSNAWPLMVKIQAQAEAKKEGGGD
jgi:hypothetical protein